MRILEITNYSAGVCGVWQRVKQEAELLSKKHKVIVFSSNAVKGDKKKIAKKSEKIGRVLIKRFNFRKIGGESFMHWNFEEEALRFKPDVIIVHSYRHLHTTKALKIGKKIGAKVFLVTHAPFGVGNRGLLSSLIVKFYDKFIGKRTLNLFDKVVIISKWEIPYLEKLGVRKEKIEYIPNGIPDAFFKLKIGKEEDKILFLGRISPIKDLSTLIRAAALMKNKNIFIDIAGPAEESYLNEIKELIKKERLEKRIRFLGPVYDLKKKIGIIDSCKVFVLPSIREGMPQSLVEAMARERVVVASNNLGNSELVKDNENGYLFGIGNSEELAGKLDKALQADGRIRKNARKSVEVFRWGEVIKRIEGMLI